MFEFPKPSTVYLPDVSSGVHIENNYHIRQYHAARDLYERAVVQGMVYRFWAVVFRRPRWLLNFETLKSKMHTGNAHYSGLKEVPIRHIIGSEQVGSNFDRGFHPTSDRSRERWVGVATAALALLPLPAIELIQIGDAYFVRDGHHRISIARALKQDYIEAEVTTWQYSWKHAPDAAVNLLAYQVSSA